MRRGSWVDVWSRSSASLTKWSWSTPGGWTRPDIARRFGAQLVHHPWRDDFAEARNVSLDRARGEWILYIDGDVRLVEPQREYGESLLTGVEEAASPLLLRPRLNTTPYREIPAGAQRPLDPFRGSHPR